MYKNKQQINSERTQFSEVTNLNYRDFTSIKNNDKQYT